MELLVWYQRAIEIISDTILSTLIDTKNGKIPLDKVAKIEFKKEPTLITREGLEYTLEVYGVRDTKPKSLILWIVLKKQ